MRIKVPKKLVKVPPIIACGKESRSQLFYRVWCQPAGTGIVAEQSLKADHIMYWLGAGIRENGWNYWGMEGKKPEDINL